MDFFEFNGIKVTVILDQEGKPWWIAREVCDILGLANVAMAVKSLDDYEKKCISINLIDFNRRESPKRTIINEPGLYHLFSKSTKPEAKEFARWIRHDVLPSIRKTGSYSIQPKIEAPKAPPQLNATPCRRAWITKGDGNNYYISIYVSKDHLKIVFESYIIEK